jgi:predicted nucleotidyltransferase
MIWPEFLDNENNVILDKSIRVSTFGKAKMWIVTEVNKELHKSRIEIGQKGYFMEGPRKIAECEVVEILRLK